MPARAVKKPKKKANLLTSLLLVFPLLLFYEVGVLFTDVMNGADLITQYLLHLVSLRGYLIVQGALLLAYIGAVVYLKRSQEFDTRVFIPVVLESGIYAMTMGTLIVFFMVDLLGIDPGLSAASPLARAGFFDRLVMSVGAGVHEEILFRLILLSGLAMLGESVFKLRSWVAVMLAFIISSVLFSAAHHLGPMGEDLALGVFVYRAMAGLFFGALFQFRSFAIAVYTHTIYDIYVLILH